MPLSLPQKDYRPCTLLDDGQHVGSSVPLYILIYTKDGVTVSVIDDTRVHDMDGASCRKDLARYIMGKRNAVLDQLRHHDQVILTVWSLLH